MSQAKKLTIAIDVDDVIADSTEALRKVVNDRYEVQLTQEHYRIHADYWGYYERVWRNHGLELAVADLEKEMEVDQSHVPLTASAAYALGELSKSYDLVIITSRNPAWETATRKWLKGHFGDIFTGIHFAKGPYGGADKSKGELCVEVGASWLVDDSPLHCASARENGVNAVLFGDYGWHHNAPADLPNCNDWPEVVEFFNAQTK